ncbi:fungal-specific transcription factor domain-containing protein [Aspergillus insuetus]
MCKGCRLRNLDCAYPQDARRTSVRTKTADLRALQQQLDGLREQLQGRKDDGGSTDGMGAGTSSRGDRASSRATQSASSPGAEKLILTDNVREEPVGLLHSAATSSVNRTRQLPVIDPGAISPPALPQQEHEVQVYGATSLLHDHPTHRSLPTSYSTEDVGDLCSKRAVQDRLISNAATSRQKEITLYITPSLTANIDFDGVPADLALHLLDLHWNRLHLLYLLTYRPAIMDSLMNDGPHINKLLLNAIYLQSSLYTDRTGVYLDSQPRTKGLGFYDRFKSLLIHYIDEPTMPTAIALLTCGACLLQYGKQSAAWVLSGMAHRMMLDLGYHLDAAAPPHGQPDFTALCIEREMRRRVYWGAYANDKFQSLFLGRPPAIHEQDCSIEHEYLDSYEELEEWKPYIDPRQAHAQDIAPSPAYRGRPAYAISTFTALLRLSQIAARIIDTFYSISARSIPMPALLRTRDEIRAQLDNWKRSLPVHLQFQPGVNDTPPPHQITPHTTYWTLIILTEQAFLTGSYFDHSANPSPQEGREKCINAALNIWKLLEAYKQAFTLRRVHYGISYATYSAVLVMLQQSRHANAQNVDQHRECIHFFWAALLEIEEGCSHSLKRPMKLLRSLMRKVDGAGGQRIDVDVPEVGENYTNPSASQAPGLEAIHGLDGSNLASFETWDSRWYSSIADDTIFGIFTQD